VNAGSGAVRVVDEWVAVLVVSAGVVAVLVVFAGVGAAAVVVGCVSGGALAFVTVFVPEPHAVSSTIAHAHSAAEVA
jgi:hypothetical protein